MVSAMLHTLLQKNMRAQRVFVCSAGSTTILVARYESAFVATSDCIPRYQSGRNVG